MGPFAFPAEDGGDFTIGLNGTYNQAWKFNVAYTHFFGNAAPLLDASRSFSYGQSRKDRDFLSLTVRRSF
jgi:long-subunit fatty acid transport protein